EEDKKTPLLFFLGEKEGLFYVTTNFQNEIFLVEKKIVELFPEDIKALEENRILFFNPDKIKRIELSYPEYEIFLEKEKNKWKIVKPIFARADDDVVKILLWQIKNTEAEKFYPHRLTESPNLEKFLKIKLLEEENHLIEIFKKKKGGKEIFLGRSTFHFLPFELKREAVEKLIVNLMEIRDRYLLHFDPLAIWKIEIKYQKKEIVCEKKGTKWKITKPQNKLAENPKVWKIVFSLKDLEFEEILEEKMKNPEKYSLTNPYLEITLYDKKEKVGSIIFGKKLPGEKIAVTSTFVEGVYTIPFSFLENIPTEEREIEYIR
ncbi:DUF4340 domain-containing protein, partial [Candidatus Aerophobetes bacterium]|nr:DUF4340 domain-containing protein [Candidatus Aerophobetes bacterium]